MANWDIKIGFAKNIACTISIDDNASPREIADVLISKHLIDGSDMDESVYLIPDKESGGVCLVDDSGFPYATLIKSKIDGQQTIGEVLKQESQIAQSKPVPKCPTCGSTNIETLGAGTRAAAGALFGVFSKTARSQFMCRDCRYKW